jgi:hypothetical protein
MVMIPTPEPATETTTNPLPDEVECYASLWEQFVLSFNAHAVAVNELRATEAAMLGDKADCGQLINEPDDKPVEEFHGRLIEKLCRKAEVAFAVPGSRLEVRREELQELPFVQIATFNLRELWKYLEKTYDSSDGETASYRLASKALGSTDELNPYWRKRNSEKEVKSVSGRKVLSVRIYGDWNYNFSAKQTLTSILDAMKCVAIWGGIWCEDHQEAFDAFKTTLQQSRGADARALGRIDCWPMVTLVSYKEKVEFRLHAALAEQIQVFLATYPLRVVE